MPPSLSFRTLDSPKSVQDITRTVIQQLKREGVDMAFDDVVPNGHPKPKPRTWADVWTEHEVPRKLLHSSIGFATLYLYSTGIPVHTITRPLWTALAAVILPADLLRFQSKRFARLYERLLGFLMREGEKNSINGVIWYILGVNLSLQLYPQDIATLSILILSWADTAASTVGRLYGRQTPPLPASIPLFPLLSSFAPVRNIPIVGTVVQSRIPLAKRKSLAGFLAAGLTASLVTGIFLGGVSTCRTIWEPTWLSPTSAPGFDSKSGPGLLAVSLVAGVVSAVVESMEVPGGLDDNVTLPVLVGFGLWAFLRAFKTFF